MRELAEVIKREYKDGEMIGINGEYEGGSSLNFYTRRMDYILNGRSANLEYGSYFQDAPPIYLSSGDLARLWSEPARMYLFTDRRSWRSLPQSCPRRRIDCGKRRQTHSDRSSIQPTMKTLTLVAAVLFSLLPQVLAQETPIAKADKLFAGRDNIESLKGAVSLMEDLTKREPSNFDGFWRIARFKFYLADHEKDDSRKGKLLGAAIDAGKKAVGLDPGRVEGHFWLAAATGEYADLKGALQSLTLVKTVRREFEAALGINPGYENGDIYSALGQIDLNLPKLFGGNERRGLERLETGLKVGANNSDLKVTLAEVYVKKGRNDEARSLLESVLSATDSARSPLEQEDIRAKARRLLEKLK